MTTPISSYGLTDAGYTAPRQADFLAAIRNQFDTELTALGYTELPDYERDTFLGVITEIMAYMLGQQAEAGQAVYDARSVSNATGLQLSNLALLVGVTRDPATYSTVTLTVTGTAGTVLTQGKQVEGGGTADDQRWVLTQDVTIPAGGSTTVTARATEKGRFIATAGQIDTIVTSVAGWSTVTNAAAATPGQNRETDAELRAKRQRALQASGSTNTNAILSALLNLDDVTGAVVVDNKTGSPVTADGITVPAHGVSCVVAPDSLTSAQLALVVQAIYERVGAGTETGGDQTATVTKADDRSETIKYYLAADEAVDLAWTLVMDPGYVAADVEEQLTEAVADYFLTLTVGQTVYPLPLIAIAGAIDGIANVTTLTLNGGSAPVTHTALQLPVLGTQTVS